MNRAFGGSLVNLAVSGNLVFYGTRLTGESQLILMISECIVE